MKGPRTIRTVCPRNCYCTCGMLVTVDGGRILRIEGDPANSATGGHVCVKGLSYAQRVGDAKRLLTPLKRRAHGDGFDPVSWHDALSDIVERLQGIRGAHGPASVLYYEGSGSHGALGGLSMAFWRQFGGCTTTHGDLCWPAGLEATRLTYGDNRHTHPRHTRDSRFVLVWGHNPAETNIHQWRLILDAQEAGAILAVVDPRSTDSTDAADLHLQPRPGTDAALALGIARVIVDEHRHDTAYLAGHATGLEPFLARLADYPLDEVADTTGIPAEDIRHLARAYATTKPALLIAGFGLQRHHHAGQTMRAVSLLPALTGNVGVAGGGWQYANLASHCLRPLTLPPLPADGLRTIPVSQMGGQLETITAPPVRAAWVERGNPASQHPAAHRVRRALGRMELVVVVDQFLTDTAALADYVLPAKSLFEEEDLVTAYWHPYVQWREKVLEPPGEVRPETEIWREMCRLFGFDTSYFPHDRQAFLRELLPAGHSDALDRLKREPLDLSGHEDVAFADGHFPTPSGRIEFASEEAGRLWAVSPVPGYTPLPEGHGSSLTSDFPLQMLTCKTRERIHSQFGNLDWIRGIARPQALDMHPADASPRGIVDGSRVVVWNNRGRVELHARVVPGIRPGVVHVIEGRCGPTAPDINVLTDEGVTDMNHGATFFECLVEVRPA
jgi:anaerobic selenocysteine-containing dehydrogenase